MALSNYTELQASVADWLDRDDMTARIVDCVHLCEVEMNRRITATPVRPAEARATASMVVDNEYLALPTDFLGVVSFEITSIENLPWRMTYIEPDNLVRLRDIEELRQEQIKAEFDLAYAPPEHYTMIDGQFRFSPTPKEAYTTQLVYWATVPPLASNATNWLLTNYPDCYLYGTLAIANASIPDDEQADKFLAMFDRSVAAMLASFPTPTDNTALRADLPIYGRIV